MAFLDSNSVASVDDFATQLVAFAVAEGGFTDEGKDGTLYRISKDGVFWNFYHTTLGTQNRLLFRMSRSLMTLSTFTSQVDAQSSFSLMCFYSVPAPYVACTFYAQGGSVHAVVELASGVFAHLSMGTMVKIGDYVGGQYITASSDGFTTSGIYRTFPDAYTSTASNTGFYFCSHPDQFVSGLGTSSGAMYLLVPPATVPSNGRNDWANFGSDVNLSTFSIVSSGFGGGIESPYDQLRQLSSNSFNGRIPLFPLYIYRYNRTENTRRILGYVEGIRYHHFTGVVPRQINDDDWEAFPAVQADFEAAGNTERPAVINRGFSYKRT